MDKDQTTTPGTPCHTLFNECVSSSTSPGSHFSENAGDRAYGLLSLSEKTRIFVDVIAKAAYSPQLFNTLSVGSVWGSNPRPPAHKSDALPTELTGWQLYKTQLR